MWRRRRRRIGVDAVIPFSDLINLSIRLTLLKTRKSF
jgi:hypothetical protein